MKFDGDKPIYLQIMELIKKQIVNGELHSGDKLPSTRDYAQVLQVNPNTVVRAYNELEVEGIAFTKRGMGTFITEESEQLERLKVQLGEKIITGFIKAIKELNMSRETVIALLDSHWN